MLTCGMQHAGRALFVVITLDPLHCVLPLILQRRQVATNIKRLKDIGCYRGRRHIMVRPLHAMDWRCVLAWYLGACSDSCQSCVVVFICTCQILSSMPVCTSL